MSATTVASDLLSDEQQLHYEQKGCLILRQRFSQEEIAALARETEGLPLLFNLVRVAVFCFVFRAVRQKDVKRCLLACIEMRGGSPTFLPVDQTFEREPST